MTVTRNRLSKYDSLEEGIATMEGRRETLQRWKYYEQVRQLNNIIGAAYLFQKMLKQEEEDENSG